MKSLKTSVFLKESVKKEEYKNLPITYKFETVPKDISKDSFIIVLLVILLVLKNEQIFFVTF